MVKVIVIVGPTAVGKTNLAVEIAKKYDGEIISGDSIQVYKLLNIGSAKVKAEETKGIKHHLIDILEYHQEYSVSDFQTLARKTIADISNRGKLPIVVGGTGLYIKALLYDYQFPKITKSKENYDEFNNQKLWDKLNELDENAAKKVHVNNRQRIITNLNLLANISETKTELLNKQSRGLLYDSLIIGLTLDREKLHAKINDRVDKMIEAGLLEELEQLNEDPIFFATLASKAIGYKEFKNYFEKKQSIEETIEEIKTHTRQFAKRQYTWFNNQMDVCWFDIKEKNFKANILDKVSKFLSQKNC